MRNLRTNGQFGSADHTVAALVAIALLLGAGIGFRALDDYLSRPTHSVPLPPGTLARIPFRIGAWVGESVALDERVREATDTDDLLNRRYALPGGHAGVELYVAYGVKARDLMPHRPEVCYPGAGWTLADKRTVELNLVDGEALGCRVLRFDHGGLDLRSIAAVDYYIVDGQYCPDVSLLRSKAWRGSRGVRHVVQVQIAASATELRDLDAAEAAALKFAADSANIIRGVLPSDGDRVTGSTGRPNSRVAP
jgi:EpsI family protein